MSAEEAHERHVIGGVDYTSPIQFERGFTHQTALH
ncbi:hypothetical protein SAMN04488144_1645 [Methylobacterium sp. 190mf]|nr:hypothetical protein SAMN04488144_1645 [Methylobacterium sp. 190mf]